MQHNPIFNTVYNAAFTFGTIAPIAGIIGGDAIVSDEMLAAAATTCAAMLAGKHFISPAISHLSKKQKNRNVFGLVTHQYSRFKIERVARTQADVDTHLARFKTRQVANEYVFEHNRLLKGPVPEGLLYRFVVEGLRRQLNAQHGLQSNRFAAGRDGYKRLTINEAWSRGFFTRRWSVRIRVDVYNDLIKLLVVPGFMTVPRQGKAPELKNTSTTPAELAGGVLDWWQYLEAKDSADKAPYRSRSRLLRSFLPLALH